jgi:hypothetical protein
MATAKQTVTPEEIKRAKTDAVIDDIVDIMWPTFDAMPPERKEELLSGLRKISSES